MPPCVRGTKRKEEDKIQLEEQSHFLPGPERVHVSMLSKENKENYEGHCYSTFEDMTTLYDAIRRGLRESGNGNCLGWRPSVDKKTGYQWLSYQTVIDRCVDFGRGLIHLGLKEKDFVGIYSRNRVEWVLTEQGLFSFSMVSVPLYDTLGKTACQFIINQAEMTTIVIEDDQKLQSLLQDMPSCLKIVIYIEDLKPETKKQAEAMGLQVYPFSEVEKIGNANKSRYPERPPKPDDIATLNYTSGTTGDPKGVIIAHRNLVASACSSYLVTCQMETNLNAKDVALSFLPLAHIYERMLQVVYVSVGASIGFYSGNVLNLMEDMQFLRPTLFCCVPRLLNRVFDKIMAGASESKIKGYLIQRAVDSKLKEVQRGVLRRNSVWDYIVFNKIQNALGGRIRLVISGGAPISGDILQFFRCALGCVVIEGYGQTETSGALALTIPHEVTTGHIGPPAPAVAIKLVDVPEMNYYSEKDEGEICIKGPLLCQGYYKNPSETEKAFDEDGWLHTGDIGTWLESGSLKIIDRKKHIFKLSQGEYIAPEKIEAIYSRCQYVSQAFVHGDSLSSYLVGIIVPDLEAFKTTYPDLDLPALCSEPQVQSLILSELNKLGRDAGLKSFEQVKDIHLHSQPFTLDQGLLTPTMKSKRPELRKYFKTEIEKMYAKPNKSNANG